MGVSSRRTLYVFIVHYLYNDPPKAEQGVLLHLHMHALAVVGELQSLMDPLIMAVQTQQCISAS